MVGMIVVSGEIKEKGLGTVYNKSEAQRVCVCVCVFEGYQVQA